MAQHGKYLMCNTTMYSSIILISNAVHLDNMYFILSENVTKTEMTEKKYIKSEKLQGSCLNLSYVFFYI